MECKKTQLHINHMNYYKENPQRLHEEICVYHPDLIHNYSFLGTVLLFNYFKSIEMEKRKKYISASNNCRITQAY